MNTDPTPPAVSDTPRTDAAIKRTKGSKWDTMIEVVDPDTCRAIERDLNAAVAALELVVRTLKRPDYAETEGLYALDKAARTVLAQIGGRA